MKTRPTRRGFLQAGRTVSAQSLVMNLVTRRIEALGKPQLTFPVGE